MTKKILVGGIIFLAAITLVSYFGAKSAHKNNGKVLGAHISMAQPVDCSVDPTILGCDGVTDPNQGSNQGSDQNQGSGNDNSAVPCSIVSFTANPAKVDKGQKSELQWQTEHCPQLMIQNKTTGVAANNLDASGTIATAALDASTTYTIVGGNKAAGGNSVSQDVVVAVGDDSSGGSCTITSFGSDPATVDKGEHAQLQWKATAGCTNITIQNDNSGAKQSNLDPSGSLPTAALAIDTSYTMIAGSKIANSGSVSQTITVKVNNTDASGGSNNSGSDNSGSGKTNGNSGTQKPNSCIINAFTANPASVDPGQESFLMWSAADTCSGAVLKNKNTGQMKPVALSGKINTIPLKQDTTYSITASSDQGQVSQDLTVTVNGSQGQNQSQNNGQDNNPGVCTLKSFGSASSSVIQGRAAVLSWSTSDCDKVTLQEFPGSKYANETAVSASTNGFATDGLTGTTAFLLRAYSGNSFIPATVTVQVGSLSISR